MAVSKKTTMDYMDLVILCKAEGLSGIKNQVLNIGNEPIDLRMALNKGDVDGLKRDVKKVTKTLEESIEAAQGRVEGLIDAAARSIRDPMGSFTGMVESSMKGVRNMSNELGKMGRAKAKAMAEKPGATGIDKVLATTLKGFSGFLSVIGPVIGGLASFISVIIDSEAQAKKFNKTFMEGGIFTKSIVPIDNMRDSLSIMRKALTDPVNNIKWGIKAEDQMAIIKSFDETGISIKKVIDFTAEASVQTLKYQEVTALALTYSRLFGQSATDMAGQQSQYMEALGTGLGFIEEQFANVYKAASFSSYSVKWFYSTVQQATSGMTMYNVRLADTANLLVKMSKVLGAQEAAKSLSGASGGFKDMSIEETMKFVLVKGEPTVQKSFERDVKNAKSDYGKKFKEMQADPMKGDRLEKLMTEWKKNKNIDITDASDVSKLGMEDQKSLMSAMANIDESFSRDIGKLIGLQKGSGGKLEEMTKYLNLLSIGETQLLKQKTGVHLGNKRLDEIVDPVELAAFANAAGVTFEEARNMQALSMNTAGSYSNLKAEEEKMKKLKESNTDESLKELEAMQLQQAKDNGVFIDVVTDALGKTTTKMVTGTTAWEGDKEKAVSQGVEIKNIDEFATNVGWGESDMEGAIEENRDYMMEMADNTSSMADKFDAMSEGILNDIYIVLGGTFDFISGTLFQILGSIFGKEEEVKNVASSKDKSLAVARVDADIADLKKLQKARGEELRAKNKEIREEKNPVKKAALEEQAKILENSIKNLDTSIQLSENKKGDIRRAVYKDDLAAAEMNYGTMSNKDRDEIRKSGYGGEDVYNSITGVGGIIDMQLRTEGLNEGPERDARKEEMLKNLDKKMVYSGKDAVETLKDMTVMKKQADGKYASDLSMKTVDGSGTKLEEDDGGATSATGNVLDALSGRRGVGEAAQTQLESMKKRSLWENTKDVASLAVAPLAAVDAVEWAGGALWNKAKKGLGGGDSTGMTDEEYGYELFPPLKEVSDPIVDRLKIGEEVTGKTFDVQKKLSDFVSTSLASDIVSEQEKAAALSALIMDPGKREELKTMLNDGDIYNWNLLGGRDKVEEKMGMWESKEAMFSKKFSGEDFISRANGQFVSFDSKDDIMAAKPGGPVDQLKNGSGSSSNGRSPVNIYIYGSQAEIYETVRKALKITGML